MVLPAKLNTQSSKIYMNDVLTRFKTELEQAAGRSITENDLAQSISTFNQIRVNLSKLYRLQSESPGILKCEDLYTIVKGSMMMDRDEAAKLLPVIVENLEKTAAPEMKGKRLVLSGSICDSPGIYSALEESGAIIVGDDLCTGQRWFEGEISENQDPMTAICERYMDRIVCPAKHINPIARGENIVSLAKKNHADGVVFMLLKFCDPHAFDYPYLKEYLDNEGIKNMLIEMDDQQDNIGQLSTRFETFIHMI